MQSSSFGLLAQVGWASLTTLRSPMWMLGEVIERLRGTGTNETMCEKLGLPSARRPPGKLIWFCAHSVAEVAVLLPVVHRCLLERREVTVLLTTSAAEAHALLSAVLPMRVILQYYPLDAPINLAVMVGYWRPDVAIFVESDLSPNLVECLSQCRTRLVLLNARLSPSLFFEWHSSPYFKRAIMARMLSRFELIVPQSEVDVGRFRMLGATIQQMPGWCADLNYAASMGACVWEMWRPSGPRVMEFRRGVAGRPLWLAVSTHEGEEACIADVHTSLAREFRTLLTIVVPRDPSRCEGVLSVFKDQGLAAEEWAKEVKPYTDVDILVVGDVGELPLLYAVCEIAFVGGSLLEGQEGHNLAEAAVTGCAVLVGRHAGQFNRMADELNEAAVLAAEEAAEAVSSSDTPQESCTVGFGNTQDEIPLEDANNPQAGSSNSVAQSPVVDESYFLHREDSSMYLNSDVSETRMTRPATAPAAVAYQWEFEPWPELQGRLGDPGWLGNERSTSRQSSVGPSTLPGQSTTPGYRQHSELQTEDALSNTQEQGQNTGRSDRGVSVPSLSRPGRQQGNSARNNQVDGSPLPLPPLQDESSVDPANTPPQEWSEASVKESLDAVPEAMLYSPTSSDGGAGKSGAENQVSTDVDRAMDTTTGSDPSIGQGSNQVPVGLTTSGISSFQYGDTPRSMGPTVDGGLWRASSSAVSPTAQQQSDGQLGSPSRGYRVSGTTNFDASFRFAGQYILPATHLPYAPHGPAVWRVESKEELAFAVSTLLKEPLERRSRGHAAAQAAAKLATGLVGTVWSVMEDMVLEPALGGIQVAGN